MDRKVQKLAHRFLLNSLVAFLIILGVTFLSGLQYYLAVSTGFLLSFVFVGSNFFVIKGVKTEKSAKFITRYYISLGLRFLLVLVALVVILKTTKIHQIYFTVSFIISYIFHSVIEIISINKLLETDN
ncbi:hypothetical protein CK503_01080 [Aliifodinibius salipaludis]|uniref:Uncharacterized protein n=1 Tax=Fodinibius salipaludis TaxID=2032627 RepID=A0A2A2GFB9_9BACT|nr:hypothetical protein CK503_01080 [Aliifodinibius salipaludis]